MVIFMVILVGNLVEKRTLIAPGVVTSQSSVCNAVWYVECALTMLCVCWKDERCFQFHQS